MQNQPTTLDKLKQAAELIEAAYYDLEMDKEALHIVRSISVAEDLVADVINYLEA